MDKNRKFKKYASEELISMKGQTIYVVEAFSNGIGYLTTDGYFISAEELPHLHSILGIELQIVDDTKFREEAKKVGDDVYDSEFLQWVERKKVEDLTDPSYPTKGGYCECEEKNVYVGMCSKCGKPYERIGG